MPDSPTFNERMLAKAQEAYEAAVGIQSTSHDGESTTFADLKAELEYWERRVATEQGQRRFLVPIVMDGGV